MVMTEEQMRKRMKEIDQERYKLSEEKKKYENYFIDKKRKEELDNHKNYIGKCFVTCDKVENEQKHIKAFKIIDVLDSPNERYASCVVLIDGHRRTCWKEYGVQIMTIGLWTMNTSRMMSRESDPKVIDFYKEITQEEFEQMYIEYMNNVTDETLDLKCEKYLLKGKIRLEAIDDFTSTLILRLSDVLYQKDIKSMTNLINDVSREVKGM